MDECMDGWMDGWIEDGWMDGWINRYGWMLAYSIQYTV